MELSDASCRILAGLLEARTGQRLTMSRRWRIETALGTLMRERNLASLDQLIAAMLAGGEPDLSNRVVDALLNNETFFFRDRAVFSLLLGDALARAERARAKEKKISIWCAGCSTGQEAYSLAMSFLEAKLRWQGWTISILGTDISGAAIAQAREGLYSQFEVQRGLPVVQMMRWFEEMPGSNWQAAQPLRDAVRFKVHNLIEPLPALDAFDIILCRNVLLYLTPDKKEKVFDNLAAGARPDACLMLGAGETVIGQTEQFVSDPDCRGLYIRRHAARERSGRRA
jgi:chemotaxis protein methyltransferase CheR